MADQSTLKSELLRSILARTAEGHVLLDPYTTLLGNGIPANFKIRCSKGPPQIPYDGLPFPPNSSSKRRKRSSNKVHRQLSVNEQANVDLHEELKEWLPEAIDKVRKVWLTTSTSPTTWYDKSRLRYDTPECSSSTNTITKLQLPVSLKEVVQPQDLVAWGKEATELQDMKRDGSPKIASSSAILAGKQGRRSMISLFNTLHLHREASIHRVITPAATYLVPPKSGFLMADMKDWRALLQPLIVMQQFNVVLLDPPWRSKSVRRSGHYEETDMYDLYQIKLPELLVQSANVSPVLVGVWVTNHAKCRKFVKDKLLPSWQVDNLVDWYWIKITSGTLDDDAAKNGGLPVWSFDGPSPRRCYEGLVLGFYNPQRLVIDTGKDLPNQQAFLSVPLEHSRKPLVTDLLRPYVHGGSMKVLELFARYVAPGPAAEKENGDDSLWFSVGNESLKYNDIGAFWIEE